MALTSYMSITGASQGDIKGDCPQAGDKKDKILVFSIDHSVGRPKDAHTGLPTGQCVHQPFTIVKVKDNASPKLFQATCEGEHLTVELTLYRIDPKGQEQNYYKVKLEGATIVNMREYSPLSFDPDSKPYHDMEEVSFAYSDITWTYTDGNIEFTRRWEDS
ncbi:MAG: Hcp family type VI secretion system effector [Hyphomicrobiales bacterium]